MPGTIQETVGAGRDSRDTTGTGDAEFWRQQWEQYEDDNAIVDVDVRGWLYKPHTGQMTRKHRLLVGLARQLSGIPTSSSSKISPTPSASSSRATSPARSYRERVETRAVRREEELISKEAEFIVREGEAEAEAAGKGDYSENPARDTDNDSLYAHSRESSPVGSVKGSLARTGTDQSDGSVLTSVQRRASWNLPANMSPAELSVANTNLMARLKPFLSTPLANIPVSAFFYNDRQSRQRTINTDASGHFNFRAALDFVPTHVRLLASERLSATEKVIITEPKGISLISDIDDTIKHSAIVSGAREIFRNAFIRELGDLTIEGVKEWYNRLAELGVKFHYVSNSPWQLYPVLTKFFSLAGLPPGSFHLKQYSGMLQGIFEPVAERKKSTLDRLARDFPERSFILVGDSGEADLEVYTDFVLENPGRVLGVYIRDVTTPITRGFFDSAMGSLSGERSSKAGGPSNGTSALAHSTKVASFAEEEDDPDLKAAIEASLRDLGEHSTSRATPHQPAAANVQAGSGHDYPKSRPRLPPRLPTEPPAPQVHQTGDLIEFSDDDSLSSIPTQFSLARPATDGAANTPSESGPITTSSSKPLPPTPRRKPVALRSSSGGRIPTSMQQVPAKRPLPPRPRRPSTSIQMARNSNPSSLPQTRQPKPDPPPKPPIARNKSSYVSSARHALSSVYSRQSSAPDHRHVSRTSDGIESPHRSETKTAKAPDAASVKGKAPPPPPRKTISSYPTAAAHYASNRVSGLWSSYAGSNADTRAGAQPYSTNANNGSKTSLGGTNHQQPLSKREETWRRRWERAEQTMKEKGVILRTWRVGTDVMEETVRLVEEAKKEEEAESNGLNERGK